MPQKVKPVGVHREEGWSYFLDDDGDVARQSGADDQSIEKVARIGFKIPDDDPNVYFIDTDGDLASQTVAEYETEAEAEWNETGEGIHKDYESRSFGSAFDPEKNRYWIVKWKRSINDLREMIEPHRVFTWRTARLPRDISLGDRVILWEGAPHLHVVGIGEVGAWDRDKDLFGNAHFWLLYQSRFIEGGPTITELRKEPLFENASFLKAAVAGTMFALKPDQAGLLAERLARLDESVREAWPDVFARGSTGTNKAPQPDSEVGDPDALLEFSASSSAPAASTLDRSAGVASAWSLPPPRALVGPARGADAVDGSPRLRTVAIGLAGVAVVLAAIAVIVLMR